jgi:hypothetical protein
MTRKRTCVSCQNTISEARPVYLVATGDGRIIGPFHPSCAATLATEARLLGHMPDPRARSVGRVLTGELYELPDIDPPKGEPE